MVTSFSDFSLRRSGALTNCLSSLENNSSLFPLTR